jgi:hypothetical protein
VKHENELLELADDELVLGWRDSEWTGIAPFLEEDVAFSSIAQNEIGHARACCRRRSGRLSPSAWAVTSQATPCWSPTSGASTSRTGRRSGTR